MWLPIDALGVLPIEERVLMDGEREELLVHTFSLLEKTFRKEGGEDGWSGPRYGWLELWRMVGAASPRDTEGPPLVDTELLGDARCRASGLGRFKSSGTQEETSKCSEDFLLFS